MPPKRKTAEEARAELHTLQTALQTNEEMLRNAVRAQGARKKRKTTTEPWLPVLRSLWLLGSPDHSELRLFLERHNSEASAENILEIMNSLELWARTISPDERQLHVDPGVDTPRSHHLKTALHFLEEIMIYRWVENLNLRSGIAPSVVRIHKYRCEHRSPLALRYLGSPSMLKRRSVNQWVHRWRLRWHITRGTIQCREHVLAEEASFKAKSKIMMEDFTWTSNLSLSTLPSDFIPECFPH
jgi:hypothetical protein